jgi:HNH endonuclease
MCASGGNWRTLKTFVTDVWRIPIDHFDPHAAGRAALECSRYAPRPLSEILVQGSTFSRGQLKKRLYEAGLKSARCELCGQGATWRGRPLSLILDHINGVRDDNRIENLQIVCPNCAATLDTHCGRNVNHASVRDVRESVHARRLRATSLFAQLWFEVAGQPRRPSRPEAGRAAAV